MVTQKQLPFRMLLDESDVIFIVRTDTQDYDAGSNPRYNGLRRPGSMAMASYFPPKFPSPVFPERLNLKGFRSRQNEYL